MQEYKNFVEDLLCNDLSKRLNTNIHPYMKEDFLSELYKHIYNTDFFQQFTILLYKLEKLDLFVKSSSQNTYLYYYKVILLNENKVSLISLFSLQEKCIDNVIKKYTNKLDYPCYKSNSMNYSNYSSSKSI